jgi:hypothetical protein
MASIRELLDLGQLVPLGLVQSAEFDIGANHQVLECAYRQDGQVVQLWIYDPNIPGQEQSPAKADNVYLEFDITDTSNGITVTRHNSRVEDYENRIYAILHMDNYAPHATPSPGPGRNMRTFTWQPLIPRMSSTSAIPRMWRSMRRHTSQ